MYLFTERKTSVCSSMHSAKVVTGVTQMENSYCNCQHRLVLQDHLELSNFWKNLDTHVCLTRIFNFQGQNIRFSNVTQVISIFFQDKAYNDCFNQYENCNKSESTKFRISGSAFKLLSRSDMFQWQRKKDQVSDFSGVTERGQRLWEVFCIWLYLTYELHLLA